MEPLTVASVAHRAAPLAGRLAGAYIRGRTLNIRVAWKVTRAAKAEGITISRTRLHAWLRNPASRRSLELHTSSSISEAAESIATEVLRQDGEQYQQLALQVIDLVVNELLKALPVSQAVATSTQMQLGAADARHDEILRRLDAANTFEADVLRLPPPLRHRLLALETTWPTIRRVVQILIGGADRRSVLQQWSESHPDWLNDAPVDALTILGELADSYGSSAAAHHFFSIALAAGVAPRAYWVTRAALTQQTFDRDGAIAALESLVDTDAEPYATALLAAIKNDASAALSALDRWHPEADEQRAQKRILAAQLYAANGDYNRAVSLAEDVANDAESTNAMLLAAQYLTARAYRGETAHRLADTQRAIALAVRARNIRRTWEGDSSEAVVLAARAAHLSGDSELAWRVTREEPDGEAMPEEAQDGRVLAEAALAAAMTVRPDKARELAQAAGSEFTQAQVDALIAELEEERAVAASAWERAWHSATNDNQRLQAAWGIAQSGGSLPDGLSSVEGYDDAVREIRLIHSVLSDRDSLTRLRASAPHSRVLTVMLSDALMRQGDAAGAAVVLADGGQRWSDPHLLAMSAKRFRDANLTDRAREIARDSLTVGGIAWAGQARVRHFLLELASGEGRWDEAVQEARAGRVPWGGVARPRAALWCC